MLHYALTAALRRPSLPRPQSRRDPVPCRRLAQVLGLQRDLRFEIEDLRDELTAREGEVESLSAQLLEATSLNQERATSIEELETRLAAAAEKVAGLEQQIRQKEQEAERQGREAEERAQALQREMAEMERTHASAMDELQVRLRLDSLSPRRPPISCSLPLLAHLRPRLSHPRAWAPSPPSFSCPCLGPLSNPDGCPCVDRYESRRVGRLVCNGAISLLPQVSADEAQRLALAELEQKLTGEMDRVVEHLNSKLSEEQLTAKDVSREAQEEKDRLVQEHEQEVRINGASEYRTLSIEH